MLRVFVYETLKLGHANHEQLTRGLRSCEPAALPGRVVDRPEGYPELYVPPWTILDRGSADFLHDLELLDEPGLTPSMAELQQNLAPPWHWVRGELLTF